MRITIALEIGAEAQEVRSPKEIGQERMAHIPNSQEREKGKRKSGGSVNFWGFGGTASQELGRTAK